MTLALLQFSWLLTTPFIFLRLSSQPIFGEMSGLNRNEKVTCDKYGTQTRKSNFGLHTRRHSTGTIQQTQRPNLTTTCQIYHSLLI